MITSSVLTCDHNVLAIRTLTSSPRGHRLDTGGAEGEGWLQALSNLCREFALADYTRLVERWWQGLLCQLHTTNSFNSVTKKTFHAVDSMTDLHLFQKNLLKPLCMGL